MNVVDDAIARWSAAEAYLARADQAWAVASAAYREAYYEAQQRNAVVDEFGLPTGQVKAFGRFDQAMLAPLERAEHAAWSHRQAAKAAVAQALADVEQFRG
ncbi:hypothetical protein [Nocardioides sp.]|uniref:hypothetical protein n=1 Tax=Nocardioides sp. TaxID=35761 RepID=UPI002630DBFD|nr:hypothetical protein [Nocardioides sp.]MDI6912202.1 hypothetical protein [Nocardioides sp.]